jgi:hypothetical protein
MAETNYEPRLWRLEEAGANLTTQAAVMRLIYKRYGQYIDQGMFSKAFRGELPTKRGGEIREMADAILTEAEKEAGVTA